MSNPSNRELSYACSPCAPAGVLPTDNETDRYLDKTGQPSSAPQSAKNDTCPPLTLKLRYLEISNTLVNSHSSKLLVSCQTNTGALGKGVERLATCRLSLPLNDRLVEDGLCLVEDSLRLVDDGPRLPYRPAVPASQCSLELRLFPWGCSSRV